MKVNRITFTLSNILDYDFEAFVGNIGGYIGLFLGYALLQIPGILFSLLTWCGKYFFKWSRTVVLPTEIYEQTQNVSDGKSSETFQETYKPIKEIKININTIRNIIKLEVEKQLKKSLP